MGLSCYFTPIHVIYVKISRLLLRGEECMQALTAILPIFMIMLLGWFLKLKRIMDADFIYKLNFIIFWVAMPALVFRLMIRCDISSISGVSLFTGLYLAFMVTPLVAWVSGIVRNRVTGFPEKRIPVSILCSIRSNNVFMGLPVISLLLGDPGLEALSIYLAVGMAGYHIMSIGIAQVALSGRLSSRSLISTVKNLVKNPIILAVAAGMVFSFSGLCEIPSSLDKGLSVLAEMASGLALLTIGASFNSDRLIAALKETWFDAFFKLVVTPALVWGAFLFWPVEGLMFKVVVLVCGMPVAVNSFSVAQGMGMDSEYAAELITTSTVLSMVTIPLWAITLGIV
jgi:predicted permease